MRRTALCGALAAALLPGIALADAGAVVKAVEAKYADVKTLTADFTQTTRSELYGDDVQRGEVVVKRPAKMRWVFSGDGKQFITDGSTMWIYSANEKQVIQYDDVSSQADSAQSLLTSLDRISEIFQIDSVESSSAHALKLRPKQSDASFKDVVLHLDEAYLVQKVIITDAFSTVTELVFDDLRLDAAVSDDLFAFQVPKGVEVIQVGSP